MYTHQHTVIRPLLFQLREQLRHALERCSSLEEELRTAHKQVSLDSHRVIQLRVRHLCTFIFKKYEGCSGGYQMLFIFEMGRKGLRNNPREGGTWSQGETCRRAAGWARRRGGLVTWVPPAPGSCPAGRGTAPACRVLETRQEGDSRGRSQGAFTDPEWALQGALEEESAGSHCAI